MQPSPETTLAIILGASDYPKSPKLSSPAFQNSADAFMRYLLNRNGFGLPENNLLDLFNSTAGPSDQNDKIAKFLQERIKELKESKVTATDLILYYVGHGTFVDPGNRYVLALKNISEGSEEISGFPIKTLANTVKENTPLLRRYVILDSCFSASAFESFQSAGPLEIARQKTMDALPPKGTALLCASGPKDAAKTPPGMKYTMFSSVLLDILERGSSELPERFSLSDLATRTEDILQERFIDAAVRPQVLSPDQSVGDVAKLAIFPNPGLGVRALSETLERLEESISGLSRAQHDLQSEQAAFKARLDDLVSVEAAGGTSSAKGDQPSNDRDAPLLMKYPWMKLSDMTKARWDTIPGPIKNQIIGFQHRKKNGLYWLLACLMVASSTWFLSIEGLVLLQATYSPLRVIGDLFTLLCGFMAFQSVLQKLLLIPFHLGGVDDTSPVTQVSLRAGPWEDYDIVVEAANQEWRNSFGLEIPKNIFSLCQLVYLVTFIGTGFIRFSHVLTLNNRF